MHRRTTGTRRLDQIDLKILIELQRHGRITNQALSERVGLSPRPCLERVRRLEQDGVISHYMAVLSLAALGEGVAAFAEITLNSQSSPALGRFEQCLRDCPEVVASYLVTGEYDYLAQIVCPTLERYNALTTAWIDAPDLAVARIVSSFVLKTVRPFSGYALPLG